MDKRNYVRNVLEFEDVKEMMECEREFAEQAGYERGIQDGLEKGHEALLRTAKNLLSLGISVVDVAKATGLSEDQIRQLL